MHHPRAKRLTAESGSGSESAMQLVRNATEGTK
jgi:hypothetical protein